MFEKFGEMDYEEFIRTAAAERQEGDLEALITLAVENGLEKEDAVTCYNTIRNNGVLFAQAPTGIGKTISTIFPAIKGLANNMGERIVYLTSKTITRVVAEEAYAMLIKNGLKIKVVSITAKEKSCLNDEVKCNGDDCKFAKDYFSKVDNAIEDIIRHENMISRDVIRKYSEKYQVCPFELSLDLTEWCHGVICDYNYAFDNRVRLKRIKEIKKLKDEIEKKESSFVSIRPTVEAPVVSWIV